MLTSLPMATLLTAVTEVMAADEPLETPNALIDEELPIAEASPESLAQPS